MEAALSEQELYVAHRAVVFDFALRRLGNLPDAENIVQEAFARVLRARRTQTLTHPRAYLLRTAANLANDLDRKRSRMPVPTETPAAPPDRSDDARVRSAVARLPAPLRSVLALRYGEDLSFAAIARELGMSKNAVHHRHGRALAALRDLFGLTP